MAPKKPSWATDPLEGAVGKDAAGALRTAGRYIGGGLQDFLGSQAVRESPFGAASSLFAPRKAYAIGTERQGPYLPDRLQRAPQAPVLPAAITSPNTTYQAADEEYRNLLAQYGGAPGISQLAGMTSLPTGFTPTGASKQATLKDYYAAQALQGNANLGTITSALTQGMQGAEATNMAAWAKANPGLAQQAYAKQMGAGQASGPGGRDIGSFISDVSKYASDAQPSPLDQRPFGTPANATPAPWDTQGVAVSAPYAEANQKAAEKTSGAEMPALNTTAGQPSTWDKAAKFLNEITPFTRTLVGPGGLGNYGIR